MSQSKIKDHKIRRGKVVSPWNHAMGSTMTFSSWSSARLPEYIWLCLIHNHYGREEGLKRAALILQKISKFESSLDKPKLSKILSLPKSVQEKIYETILSEVDKNVLAPITSIFKYDIEYDSFWSAFYVNDQFLEYRIETIKNILKKYYEHQSNDATDIRYLVVMNQIYQEKLIFHRGVNGMVEALKKYSITSHDDERMRSYRPSIRACEIGMDDPNSTYIDLFWKGVGMATECDMFFIKHEKCEYKNEDFIKETADAIEILFNKSKENSLYDEKFKVITSMTVFAYKIMKEIIDKDMGNSISGRSSIRSMVETYIVMKYLLKMSNEKINIWQEYQQYGIGKFKLILLKAREANIDKNCHVNPDLLDIYVNEDIWEEFIDTDLRYFDQMNIRQKSEYVEEKELFDILYDYDSNYTHALWGAIRESAMLKCNNPAHKFHAVPDFSIQQNCIDVTPDMVSIMKKIMILLNNEYLLPEEYMEKIK